MRLIILVLSALVGALAAPGSIESKPSLPQGRIIGGLDALQHEFPSMVSVRRVFLTTNSHICGGTIYNNLWVLTAAQCVVGNNNYRVWAGSHNINIAESTRQDIAVSRVEIHPDYVAGEVGPSDIALLRLATPLTFTQAIQPMILPPEDHSLNEQGPVSLVGWGATSTGTLPSNPSILQKAIIPLITYAQCEAANGGPGASPLGPTNVCTGPLTGGIGACAGDGGGPIYRREDNRQIQIGIVSWIWTPCASPDRPSGVFVGVSHYLPWMRQIIQQG
ncbi:trypsin-1-like [Uranotaenia lowii]|uniref:trypsin-1-like n=1 Tax=Uranotaenia lowii TaxID=190385 RepID=UPI00247A724E|nr:trypsin-1-like [Uranotaenia lowii]